MTTSEVRSYYTGCHLCQNGTVAISLASHDGVWLDTSGRLCPTCNLVYLTDDSILSYLNYRPVAASPTPSSSSKTHSNELRRALFSVARSPLTKYEALSLSLQLAGSPIYHQLPLPTRQALLAMWEDTSAQILSTLCDDLSKSETTGGQSTVKPTPSGSSNPSRGLDLRTLEQSSTTSERSRSDSRSQHPSYKPSPE